MIKIAPSLLSADFSDLRGQIARAEQGGADWLHLDVMDGHFVPNITFGPPLVKSVRKITKLPLDTHLMIENADRYIEAFRSAGSDIITVHHEACPDLRKTIALIKKTGAKAGVSIKPATSVSVLEKYVDELDLILIMSVEPGFGGQAFMPGASARLEQASALIKQQKPSMFLEVDGGIDAITAETVAAAGADVLVAGNSVFRAPDIKDAIKHLRESGERGATRR